MIYRYNNITVPTSGQATAAVFWQNRSGTNTGGVMEGNYLVGGASTLRNETMRGLVVCNTTFGGGLHGDLLHRDLKGRKHRRVGGQQARGRQRRHLRNRLTEDTGCCGRTLPLGMQGPSVMS